MPTSAIEFHDEASAEYDAAFDWYLEQSPDAALKFDAEVERALALILQAPHRWTTGHHATRRFLLRHFPYILIYREIDSETIQIVRSHIRAEGRDIGSSGFKMRWRTAALSRLLRCS